MSHTREPWSIGTNEDGGIEILSHDGKYLVADVYDIDDARRIVACVNACAGFETGWLEGLVTGGSSLERDIDLLVRRKAKAEHQRDELLEALKTISASACQERGNAIELKEIAQQAIQKCEGKL